MLMNLKTLDWDNDMLAFFDIDPSMLPTITSSAQVYGHVQQGSFKGVPISGVLGLI